MKITPSREKQIQENLNKRLSLIPRIRLNLVLDVGCGDGAISSLIRNITEAKIYGVDISEKHCMRARERGIMVKQADLEQGIPYEDNLFDLVFAGEVIEHLKDPDFFLQEIYRVLKKNGIVVITTPNLASWHNRILLMLGLQPYNMEASSRDARIGYGPLKRLKNSKPAGHLRIFTKNALQELLELYGFTIEKMAGYPSDMFPAFIYQCEKTISLLPSLASQLLARAKK